MAIRPIAQPLNLVQAKQDLPTFVIDTLQENESRLSTSISDITIEFTCSRFYSTAESRHNDALNDTITGAFKQMTCQFSQQVSPRTEELLQSLRSQNATAFHSLFSFASTSLPQDAIPVSSTFQMKIEFHTADRTRIITETLEQSTNHPGFITEE